jgi:anti-sigma B factor antagonist
VLEAKGEVDLLTGPQLAAHLNAAVGRKHGNVIVDLRNVDFADSVCLKILLNAQIRLTRQSRRLVVLCGEGPVRRLIELTRLLDTLGVIDDISQYRHSALILDERQHH